MVRTLIEEENMPVVKNIRDCEAGIKNPNDVYIGRGSKWGNPFVIGVHGTREQVVHRYVLYLSSRPDLIDAIPELESKNLICYCAPKLCHGHVLQSHFTGNPFYMDYAEGDKHGF